MVLPRYVVVGSVGVCFFILLLPLHVLAASKEKTSESYYHYLIGLLKDKEDDYEQALLAYKKALRSDSGSWEIHFRLAIDLLRANKFKEAEEELNKVVKLRPYHERARYLLALVYSYLSQNNKAIKEFDFLLKKPLLELNEEEVRYTLLQLYVKNNLLDEALEQCRLILEKSPDDSLAQFYVGYIYSEQKKIKEAIEAFITAIEKNPDNALALNSLSYLYAEEGINLDDAQKLVEKALKLEPTNGAYLDTLGWVYFKKGQLKEAERYLSNASIFMEDSEIYDHLGQVYYEMGEFEKAKTNWQKALKLEPKRIIVKQRLQKLIRQLKQKNRKDGS